MQIDVNEVDLSEKEESLYELPLADLAAFFSAQNEKDAAFSTWHYVTRVTTGIQIFITLILQFYIFCKISQLRLEKITCIFGSQAFLCSVILPERGEFADHLSD